MASIVTLLTLNTNKRADLGGLASIIKETKPHVIFIQEALSYNLVSSLASASGYSCWASTLPGIRRDRTLAVLSRLPHTAVQEVVPGQAQLVTVGGLSFINIHAPSIKTESNAFFTSIRPHLSSPIAPVLIGDFNCCQFPIDYGLPVLPHHHRSTHLHSIIQDFLYTDSFRTLHPTAVVFSFHRRGCEPSRLDRAYIPPLLESRPRVARYLPTTSDHHAYLIRLETAGLALLPTLSPPSASSSLYWKLNSSLLSDPRFLPAFRAIWEPLAASRPRAAPDRPAPPPLPRVLRQRGGGVALRP